MDGNGGIFHITGRTISEVHKNIYQFFPESGSFRRRGALHGPDRHFATVMANPETVLIFGGWPADNRIYELNLTSWETRQMGSLPTPRYYSSGFWVESQGAAYIFPSHVPAFPAYTRIVK